MAVIRDYMNGPCRIIVRDDSIRPPEEVKKIIDRVSEIVINEDFRRYMEQKQKAQSQKEDSEPADAEQDVTSVPKV